MQLDDDSTDLDLTDDEALPAPKSIQTPMAARRTLETILERRALHRQLRDDLCDDAPGEPLDW